MSEEKEQLLRCYNAIGEADRAYLMGIAMLLKDRAEKAKPQSPGLTLVVGGRDGVTGNGNLEASHDDFSSFGVRLSVKT